MSFVLAVVAFIILSILSYLYLTKPEPPLAKHRHPEDARRRRGELVHYQLSGY